MGSARRGRSNYCRTTIVFAAAIGVDTISLNLAIAVASFDIGVLAYGIGFVDASRAIDAAIHPAANTVLAKLCRFLEFIEGTDLCPDNGRTQNQKEGNCLHCLQIL